MGRRRYTPADPTANTAIRRADQAMRNSVIMRAKPRRLVEEFPEIFDGLLPHEAKAVAFDALGRAGGDPWAITKGHLEQARNARSRR